MIFTDSMPSDFAKFALLEDIHFLSIQIQRFYLQLVSEIDFSLQSLRNMGATPDLIHAHLAYPDGLAAIEYGREIGRPVVISVHGHDVREIPDANPLWRALVARALQGAERVIASSGDVRARVRALGVPDERYRIGKNIAKRRAAHAVSHKAEQAEFNHKKISIELGRNKHLFPEWKSGC